MVIKGDNNPSFHFIFHFLFHLILHYSSFHFIFHDPQYNVCPQSPVRALQYRLRNSFVSRMPDVGMWTSADARLGGYMQCSGLMPSTPLACWTGSRAV